MKILIPVPLPGLPKIAKLLGEEAIIASAQGTSEWDLLEVVPEVDALVATGMDVSERVLVAGKRLRVVGTPQVGVDRIDVEAATRLGIPVLSSQGLPATAVSEFAVGLMLDLTRHIHRSNAGLHSEAGWGSRSEYAEPERRLARELRGSTIGVVGLGVIGSETARICREGFSCRVLGFDPLVAGDVMAERGIEKFDDLVQLAAEVDFLVLHVPLVPATRHLIGAEVIAAMKPTSYVVNVARGGVLDESVLLRALDSGDLAGAALDVFESEPLPSDSPLLQIRDLLLTPHIAGVTHQWNHLRSQTFAAGMLNVVNGTKPESGLANPEVWDKYLVRRSELGA